MAVERPSQAIVLKALLSLSVRWWTALPVAMAAR